MLRTPSPLTERLTLFWHGHFVSSLQKVKRANLIYQQNALLRREAGGNFARLLHGVAKDPAMIVYLDGQKSKRDKPNENFARELMELFTLGEGQGYDEADIKEAARAFTGWKVRIKTGAFVSLRQQTDPGRKQVLGTTGPLSGEDVIDILLAHPRTAEHIVEKLWRAFVSPDPSPMEVKRLAQVFRGNRYEMRPLLIDLFSSDAFYAPVHRGSLIKSPVDLLVGTLRFQKYQPRDDKLLPRISRSLGQDLLDPPNVKGWPGGAAWITADSLQARQRVLRRASRGMEAKGGNGMGMMAAAPERSHLRADQLARLILPFGDSPVAAGTPTATAMADIFLDPRYQIK